MKRLFNRTILPDEKETIFMNYKNIIRFATFFILALLAFNGHATYFSSVKRFSVDDGLPATTIFSLLKDPNGYFWLGTLRGLIRYDGYRFEIYSNNTHEGLAVATPDAGNIFMDSQHRIWVGSWGNGLALYDSQMNLIKHFKFHPNNPKSIGSDFIQTFFEDSKGNIWVGTNGGGLAVYEEAIKQFKRYEYDETNPASLNHDRVWSISETSDGSIWAATQRGLNRLLSHRAPNFEHFTHDPNNAEGLNHPLVRVMLVDKHQRMWIGTETGFGEYDYENNHFHSYIPNMPFNAAVTKLKQAVDGSIWVGTQKGLYRFDPEQRVFTPLVNEANYALLPHDDIRDIYFDRDQALWVATRYAGLTKIDLAPSIFDTYTEAVTPNGEQVAIKEIFDVYEDKNANIWVGSNIGLLKLVHSKLVIHHVEGMALGAPVFSISGDTNDRLWLGTPYGLGVLSSNLNEYQYRNDIFPEDILSQSIMVNELIVDSGNNLWVSVFGKGLYRYDGKNTMAFVSSEETPDAISSNLVTQLYEDNRGRIWVGTQDNGLNRLDPGRTRFFHYKNTPSRPTSLSAGPIYAIHQSDDGAMWIGTSTSLNKLIDVTDTFELFKNRDDLASSNIKSILEDEFGDLWISTNAGLAQFKRHQNFFINHNQNKTVVENQFGPSAALHSKTQGLFFGGKGGIINVRSGRESRSPKQSFIKPQITSVWIDGNRVPKYSFNDDTPLLLDHSIKNIRIRYSALTFDENKQNQYSHRLLNFDNKWSPMESTNQVNFSGINPGSYVFQLQSHVTLYNQNIEPTSLRIIITTPWWKQPYLYVTLVSTILLTFFIAYKYRTRTLARQKTALEREISSRSTELLEAQKQLIEAEKSASLSGLVAGVAHEINTPIGISVTAASNLIERSTNLKRAFDEKRLKRSDFEIQIKNIHDSAEMVLSNLKRASDLIGSFKEVSVDQISQKRRTFELKHYMEEIIMSLTPKLKTERIGIRLECPSGIIIDSYPGAIAQMITNLTINAIIHAFENRHDGIIDIRIKELEGSPKKVYLKFSDNGKGIAKDRLTKIFEPFYTTKRGKGGSGLGLQIISNIATLRLGGSIRCESELGLGTHFHIEFLTSAPSPSDIHKRAGI